jgi:hypothetical protein
MPEDSKPEPEQGKQELVTDRRGFARGLAGAALGLTAAATVATLATPQEVKNKIIDRIKSDLRTSPEAQKGYDKTDHYTKDA